jgi:tellurium resistance protein TerD
MAVSLAKGQKVSLSKAAVDAGTTLDNITVGLGWDISRYDGSEAYDLDTSAFLLNANGKVANDERFVFYGNTEVNGVRHQGDNRTGDGDGDDEQIKIKLSELDSGIEKIAISVTIDSADVRNQNFGMVENAYIRVIDKSTGSELLRYDLCEDFSIETAIVVAEIYKHNGDWKFSAVGSGFSGGLEAICKNFGVNV